MDPWIPDPSSPLVREGLVDPDVALETLAGGFAYTEGPAWDERTETLVFHDLVNDVRHVWSERDGLRVTLKPTAFANGMAYDAEGRLFVCEAGRNSVTRTDRDGTVTVIASHYRGKELNSPNDLAIHSNGDVYFTDPAYGRIPVYGIERPQQLPFQGIFRIPNGTAEPELVSDELEQPNGLAFSPDESVLYVADCETGELIAFDVDADGGLSGRRVFSTETGVPCPFQDVVDDNLPSGYLDGTAVDERGNVYQTGLGGVCVVTPAGEVIGVLPLPQDIANLTWGGPDLRDLYFCCRRNLFRARMNVSGCLPVLNVAS
jgi:gluconolactonase